MRRGGIGVRVPKRATGERPFLVIREATQAPAHYADTPVRTGNQARAYSMVIAVDTAKATGGRTYSEIAADCVARGCEDGRCWRSGPRSSTSRRAPTHRVCADGCWTWSRPVPAGGGPPDHG